MNVINLKGAVRNDFGKQASKSVRREGLVPCVLYGGDNIVHFTLDTADLKPLVYTPDFNKVEISIDGKVYSSILKDIQFHPVSEIIEHIDFQELVDGRAVKVSVPVKLYGDSEGVKEGGSLVTVLRKIQLKTTPEHLISVIKGDISELNLNQSISIKEMELPEGVEVLQDLGSPVGYIEVPRSLKSAESELDEEGMEGEGDEGGEATAEGETTSED